MSMPSPGATHDGEKLAQLNFQSAGLVPGAVLHELTAAEPNYTHYMAFIVKEKEKKEEGGRAKGRAGYAEKKSKKKERR